MIDTSNFLRTSCAGQLRNKSYQSRSIKHKLEAVSTRCFSLVQHRQVVSALLSKVTNVHKSNPMKTGSIGIAQTEHLNMYQ